MPAGNPVAVYGQPADVEGALAPPDAAVIAASLRDAGRFGEIFDRHYADINRWLARRVGASVADDLTYDEIAAALAISPGTVRSRLSRARAHIRELLAPSGQVSMDSATEGGANE